MVEQKVVGLALDEAPTARNCPSQNISASSRV